MKVILPVAGFGSRLRPHTLFKSKPLLHVAGSNILAKILDQLQDLDISEYIFVTGYKAEQIEDFVKTRNINARCVLQSNPQGLGEAIHLCTPYLNDDEPVLIILGDTLFEADLKSITESTKNVLCTRWVEDPSRFGVAVIDENNVISKLVEKPSTPISHQAIVGIYWINNTQQFKTELNYLIENDVRTRGEYQLTDALARMLESGAPFLSAEIKEWLDCGKAETWLTTNAHVLKTDAHNHSSMTVTNSQIIEPCYIGKNAIISHSIIGPNVTILDNCTIQHSQISDSILDTDTLISHSQLNNSLIGDHSQIQDTIGIVNCGCYSEITGTK